MQRYLIYLFLGLLIGCSQAEDPAPDAAVEETVIDPQLQALEKAKELEQQVEEAAEKQRQQIEDQDG